MSDKFSTTSHRKGFLLLNVRTISVENLVVVKPYWINQNRVTKLLLVYSFFTKQQYNIAKSDYILWRLSYLITTLSFFFSYTNHNDVEKHLSYFLLFYLRSKRIFFVQIIKAKMGSFYGLIRLVSYCFASFVTLKTKAGSFYALIRHLFLILLCLCSQKTKTASAYGLIRTFFLVLLLRFWLQNQNGKFLCIDKTFVSCSFAWFMAIKFETGISETW